ncbi:VOC family protein [Herpetosiphon llansteffanensis]|uniref:VOC family protein n=1 Tax=Herpetosiphon llansteffanensis TaxID=2094568 RepID=UPI000D7CA045|nr:VOC family protein [Herpetosiphon llansteffanensis]
MMPLATWIDHLVVTAPNLAFGVAYIEDLLGVPMQAGGQHQAMATHNSVLKLGTNCYLEVIAPYPKLLHIFINNRCLYDCIRIL